MVCYIIMKNFAVNFEISGGTQCFVTTKFLYELVVRFACFHESLSHSELITGAYSDSDYYQHRSANQWTDFYINFYIIEFWTI